MEELLNEISARVPVVEWEYLGEDGLLHCEKCKQPTQTEVEFLGTKKIVRCICKCKSDEIEAQKNKERQDEILRKKRFCFQNEEMIGWNFDNDDRQNEKLSDAMQNYVENFETFRESGMGLLLYGSVGTGKTYYASCIANALLEKGYSVIFRTFKQLERGLWNAEDKEYYMNELNRYSLLILDDLGAERDSKYMSDIVFDIIDSRYKSGLPFIVTTNLTADEIKKAQEVTYSRIYDRVLERCHPISVDGKSRRRESLKNNYQKTQKLLGL